MVAGVVAAAATQQCRATANVDLFAVSGDGTSDPVCDEGIAGDATRVAALR